MNPKVQIHKSHRSSVVLASLQEKAKEGKGTCDRPEDRTASEELQTVRKHGSHLEFST